MNHEEKRIRLRDFLKAHPDNHDQGDWEWKRACGTTRCAGGWAIVLEYQDDTEYQDGDSPLYRLNKRYTAEHPEAFPNPDAEAYGYAAVAAHILGLSEEESDFLFYICSETGVIEALDFLIMTGSLQDYPGFVDRA